MAYDKKYSRMNNGVLFIDGNCTYAKAEEVNNPEIKAKQLEHKVLGAIGTVKLPSGYDAMEASFKLNGPLDEVAAMSADIKKSHEFIFRGSVEGFTGQDITSERPYVVIYRGTFTNSPAGAQKQHENVELMYNLSITYYKLIIAGVTLVEIDFVNNILKVNGIDKLAKYNANVGL